MLEYHAAYYKIEDGWYLATILDFPGVVTQGKTLLAARRMLRDALREMAEWYLEDKQTLPTPDPKVKDKKAEVREPMRLVVRILSAATP